MSEYYMRSIPYSRLTDSRVILSRGNSVDVRLSKKKSSLPENSDKNCDMQQKFAQMGLVPALLAIDLLSIKQNTFCLEK